MIQKIISDYLENGEKVVKYQQALKLLKEAGFLDLLRKFGYPSIIDGGSNPNSMAVEAARSHGFQSAVSHIEFFMEMYAFKSKGETITPNFGADQFVIKEKIMTQDELNKLKGGKI